MNSRFGLAAIRVFCGAVAIWAAVQMVYLSIALSSLSPSEFAERTFTHNEPLYLAFLGLQSFAVLVFGVGAYLSGDVWRRLTTADRTGSTRGREYKGGMTLILYIGFALFLGSTLVLSLLVPKYDIFVDLSAETLVRRDTHLFPLGIVDTVVPFFEIDRVTGEFVIDKSGRPRLRYILSAVTKAGQHFEIGRGQREELGFSRRIPPQEMSSLAQAIADKSGAELRLR